MSSGSNWNQGGNYGNNRSWQGGQNRNWRGDGRGWNRNNSYGRHYGPESESRNETYSNHSNNNRWHNNQGSFSARRQMGSKREAERYEPYPRQRPSNYDRNEDIIIPDEIPSNRSVPVAEKEKTQQLVSKDKIDFDRIPKKPRGSRTEELSSSERFSRFNQGGSRERNGDKGMIFSRASASSPTTPNPFGWRDDHHLSYPNGLLKNNHDAIGLVSNSKPEYEPTPEITKDNWSDFSFQQQVLSQYPDLNNREQSLTILKEKFSAFDNLRANTEIWFEQKVKACEYAYEEIHREMKETQQKEQDMKLDDASTDSCRSYTSSEICGPSAFDDSDKKLPYDPDSLKAFFDALPFNLIFNAGFDVYGIRPRDDENCYCPCCDKMKEWRHQFYLSDFMELADLCDATGKKAKKMLPTGLMSHLDTISEKGGLLHKGIALYLKELYKNHSGGLGHKALYKPGDQKYKEIEAYERRIMIESRNKLVRELEQEKQRARENEKRMREIEKEKEEAKRVHAELFKEFQELENAKRDLGIKLETKVQVSENDIERHRNQSRFIFDLLKKNVLESNIKNSEEKVVLDVTEDFDIQYFFDFYSNKKEREDKTYLFRDLDYQGKKGYHNKKLLQAWNVKVEACIKASKHTNDYQAVDEGGPTSQFLSEFWNQMGDLVIKFDVQNAYEITLVLGDIVKYKKDFVSVTKKSKHGEEDRFRIRSVGGDEEQIDDVTREELVLEFGRIKLFEREDECFIPVTDEKLENDYDKFSKYRPTMTFEQIKAKAKVFYRAIGRVMFHCVSDGKNSIAGNTLPSLYKNYLFRGAKPGEKGYHPNDLYYHLIELDKNCLKNLKGHTVCDYMGFFGYEDEKFLIDKREMTFDIYSSLVAPKKFIEDRQIAVNGLKEGLTLNETISLENYFSQISFDAVNKLFFSIPHISCEDVIQVLEPYYPDIREDDSVDQYVIDNREQIPKEQKHFFEVILPSVLRDRSQEENSTFLSDFVKCFTGSSFLPNPSGNPDFKITIDFCLVRDFDLGKSREVKFDQNSVPVAFTCTNTMIIPGLAYGNNREIFEKKLDTTLTLARQFSMN